MDPTINCGTAADYKKQQRAASWGKWMNSGAPLFMFKN